MLEEFSKFKKRIQLEFLLSAIGTSLGSGATVFGILFLCYKRKWISLKPIFAILIGLGVALVVFGVYFLINRPRDKKIAKRLDKTFQLNEKVQTMIEYQGKEEPILVLQREDTERRLKEITPKGLKLRIPVFFYILLIFGLSSVTASAAVPMVKPPQESPINEDDYTVTEWQIAQIKELIAYVEASKASDIAKGGYVTQLNMLIGKLEEATKSSQMKDYVLGAISNILLTMNLENTNSSVYSTLKATEVEKLGLLGESIKDYNTEDLSSVLFSIQRGYEEKSESDISGLMDDLEADSQALRSQLDITVLSKQDSFYIALDTYEKALAKTQAISTAKVMQAVRDALNALEPALVTNVSTTKENRDVAWYVEDKLRELFGLGAATNRDTAGNNGSSSGDSSGSQMDPNAQGGYGAGDYIFGSSDVLYDYDQNKLVPYGELYDKYYAVINGLINDGSLSEEMIEYVNQYLASLTNVKN